MTKLINTFLEQNFPKWFIVILVFGSILLWRSPKLLKVWLSGNLEKQKYLDRQAKVKSIVESEATAKLEKAKRHAKRKT